MGDLRYCFEQEYVARALKNTRAKGLAVIDSDGISASTVRSAVDRGVFVYDYLNVGALEKGRDFYWKFKDLRLAEYEGWPGEYWIDPTSAKWKQHIIEQAKQKKKKGAIGVYLDNGDILWKVKEGFKSQDSEMLRKAPSADAVYRAMLDIITTLVMDVGLIVMPNGADLLVRKMFADGYGKPLIHTINQEGVFFENFQKQSKEETAYRLNYVKWAQKNIDGKVRIIEYCKSKKDIAWIKTYCALHGIHVYVSKHTDLRGD